MQPHVAIALRLIPQNTMEPAAYIQKNPLKS